MDDQQLKELIAVWKDRRKQLRRAVFAQPENRRLLYARADELRDCYQALEVLVGQNEQRTIT